MNNHIADKYYQIGEVSKICNIPIRTLHYYDEIDLLKPKIVDRQSKYRYYSPEQIPAILLIKSYKTAGFALVEIKKLLQRDHATAVQEMVKDQCQVIDQKILELQLVKEHLQTYLQQNKLERRDGRGLQLKELPEMYQAYKRYRSPCTKENFILRYAELLNIVEGHGLHMAGSLMAIYYEAYEEPNYKNMDFEVCVRVAEQRTIEGILRRTEPYTVLSALHYGSYKHIPDTCLRMFEWMKENDYIPYGPYMEDYLVDLSSTLNEEEYITELIRPVKKRA